MYIYVHKYVFYKQIYTYALKNKIYNMLLSLLNMHIIIITYHHTFLVIIYNIIIYNIITLCIIYIIIEYRTKYHNTQYIIIYKKLACTMFIHIHKHTHIYVCIQMNTFNVSGIPSTRAPPGRRAGRRRAAGRGPGWQRTRWWAGCRTARPGR